MQRFGMDKNSGAAISEIEHLRQSITDILSTPIGSRIMRRNYGAKIFHSVDAPLTRSNLVDMYANAAEALSLWEPRFQLTEIQVVRMDSSGVSMKLSGYMVESGEFLTLEGIEI
ncbi:GPW/gp25 family protein [Microbulbifer sp. THAF38]|uniref:GPW/gp25 family protein n=1 Tax=Microbulbifer sp. THAF38 TaxID=2587856 RepID=UPI001269847F|nr:GPW/gp25 family protein [Microbulbifer sp. THAF38]QFT56606.1 Gene 25-like lysozyme [Microbulbifer sp. THAF38]